MLVFNLNAQDPIFTNSQQSLLYLNPSFAGSNGFIRNQFAYRNQWPNLSGTYVTYLNSFDAYIKPIRGGLGISASLDDQAKGTLKTSRLDLTYAQHFSLLEGKLIIIPSLQATYLQRNLDKTKLNFGDFIDGRFGFVWNSLTQPSQSKKNIDFSSGLLINYKNFYFGSSVFHFNQPDIGLMGSYKLPYRLSIHSSYNFHISEKTLLNFFVNYQSQQKLQYLHLNVNALLVKHFLIGCCVKSSDNINLNVGYKHNIFSITYDYDVVVSKLLGNTTGSHEVSASFNLRSNEQRKLLTDFERW